MTDLVTTNPASFSSPVAWAQTVVDQTHPGWYVLRCEPIPRSGGWNSPPSQTLLVVLEYAHEHGYEVTHVELQCDAWQNLVQALSSLPKDGLISGTRFEMYRTHLSPLGRHRRGW